MDRQAFPVLQDSADGMEEQCPAQPVAQQVLPEGGEGSGKLTSESFACVNMFLFSWLLRFDNIN